MSMPMHSTSRQDLTTSKYWDRQWTTAGILDRQDAVKQRKKKRARTQPFIALMADAMEHRDDTPATVLEVGCAPGYLLAEYANLRAQDRLSGVDFTTEGLNYSRQLFAEQQLRATWHQADVREFVPEDLFDLVYSCGLIEHFTDPVSILRDHVRLCKPGGIVAVSIPNYSGAVQAWFMRRLDPEALVAHNTAIMHTTELYRLMSEAGLREIRVGGVGPATIRSRAEGTGLKKQLLRRVAQAWNFTSKHSPGLFPWHSTLWAIGQVPAESGVAV